jgi:ATP-dependent DNA ligase
LSFSFEPPRALTIPDVLAEDGVLNPDSWQKTSKTGAIPYLPQILKGSEFRIPTVGTTVPDGPEWLHEIKYDGYRLRVERNDDRVRLITKGGWDWSKRYPWIVEAALKNRTKQFVIDNEEVILGVDGRSDFDALHSGKHNEEVQLYAFDVLAGDGDDMRLLPLSIRNANLGQSAVPATAKTMASILIAIAAPPYSHPTVKQALENKARRNVCQCYISKWRWGRVTTESRKWVTHERD